MKQATNTRPVKTSAIIEQTKPAVAIPLVLPRFLAAIAKTMPTIATMKAGNMGINMKNKLKMPSTKDAMARLCPGCGPTGIGAPVGGESCGN
jgi:hypothetical protein